MSDQDRISFHNIVENNTWECIDMEFLSECGEQVRCWVECEKGNSTFTSNHVLSGLLYKHSNPLLRRKVNFLNEGKN